MAKKLTVAEVGQLPVGSLLALPRAGWGVSGIFAVVAPGYLARLPDAQRYPDDERWRAPLQEWLDAEGAEQIYLVYRGKGRIPSATTASRHWDKWKRECLTKRSTNPPSLTLTQTLVALGLAVIGVTAIVAASDLSAKVTRNPRSTR